MDVRWVWVFIDSVRPAGPAWEFWRAVTDSTLSPTRGDRGQFATLLPPQSNPWIKVQEVDAGGGVHLDFDVINVNVAADYATLLGARELHRFPEGTTIVMASPGGFVFCLTTWDGVPRANRTDSPAERLDQVALDVPPEGYAAETAFWADLLGVTAEIGSRPEFTVLTLPGPLPIRLLLQRLDDPGSRTRVTGHVDIACADRAASRARHLELGAAHVGDGPRWSVLRAPGGAPYCLTDRDPGTGRLP